MTDKPFRHELKAHDFTLVRNSIAAFPQDGRVVVVECSDGKRRNAVWNTNKRAIAVNPELPKGVELTAWLGS